MTLAQPAPPVLDQPLRPPVASWGRRVVAALLDSAVLGAVAWFAVGDAVVAPTLQPSYASAPDDDVLPWTSSGVLVVAWLLMLVLQGLTGQTPGRRVLGIEVVRAPVDGPVEGPPGVVRSVVRWCAHLLDAILFIGYLRPLWHPERRTFADGLVGTLVVHREPRADGRGRGVTAAAWFAVVVGVAFGVSVGESSGVERGDTRACVLDAQAPDAPLRVQHVTLVREVEWRRGLRPAVWSDDTRRAERSRLSVEVMWERGADDLPAPLLVRTTTGGTAVDNEISVDAGWASFPLEPAGAGPLDVEVVHDGRTLTTCSVPLPAAG